MINYRDMSLKIIADMATEQLNEINLYVLS